MTTSNNFKTRKEMALSMADQIDWRIEPVECDDYGDTGWRWHVTFVMDMDGKNYEVYDDYYREKPNDVTIYNNMLESIKDGSMGDTIVDILTRERR